MWERELGPGDVLRGGTERGQNGSGKERNSFGCVAANVSVKVLFLLTKGIIWRDTVSQNYTREHVEK